MIRARFTVASAPCCTAICTRRPRGASTCRLRGVYGRAHHIEHEIDIAELLGEIELLVVDRPFGAESFAGAALLVAACGGE